MHLITVKGPSTLLFTYAVFAAGEINKKDNLIEKLQWHTASQSRAFVCLNIKHRQLNESLISVA